MKKIKFLFSFSLTLLTMAVGFNFKAGALGRTIIGPDSSDLRYWFYVARCGEPSDDKGGVERFHLPNGRIISHVEANKRVRNWFKIKGKEYRQCAIKGNSFIFAFINKNFDGKEVHVCVVNRFIWELAKKIGIKMCREDWRTSAGMCHFVGTNLEVFSRYLEEHQMESREILKEIFSKRNLNLKQVPKKLPHIYEITDDPEIVASFSDPKYFLPEDMFN